MSAANNGEIKRKRSPETSTAWVLRAKEASERAAPMAGAHNRAALSSTGPATFAALKQIVVKWKEYCNAEEKGRLEAATDSIDASDPKEVAASAKEVRAILVTAWMVRQHLVGLMRGVYKTTRKSFGGSGMSENDFKQLQDLEDTMKEWTEDMHALREAGKEGDEEGQ